MKNTKMNVFYMVIVLWIAVDASASATEVFSRDATGAWNKGVSVVVPVDICYVGPVDRVCLILKLYDTKMRKRYSQGEHEYLELKMCQLGTKTVRVDYLYQNDYVPGAGSKHRYVIDACRS